MATRPMPAVWEARLGASLDPRARALNDSLPVDRRLWPEELALARAYVPALVEAGILPMAQAEALRAACDSLAADLGAGTAVLAGEDVHSAIEHELERRCGEPARRLHTGRSRNDQVATLLRMRVMQLAETGVEHVRELERAILVQARAVLDQPVAAHTHLQPAQPILLAHGWLAHVEALERDEERLLAAREAADRLPLGAGAVAGTPLVYDRVALATRLGFSRLAGNSVDAVGDRDFALEYLHAAAMLGLHLSRLSEDVVLWCSPGFGWYRVSEGFSTGSSLLPQKRNPDLFELGRAKCARLLANYHRLATVMKGLPSAYQKDLQEDKEAVFDTGDTLEVLVPALSPAVAALVPCPHRMRESLTEDLLAVELADGLVADGMPFRDAHAAVGRLWAAAERAGVPPSQLSEEARLALSPWFTTERLRSLTVESGLARRNHPPGTGPESVRRQLQRAEERLGLGPGEGEVLRRRDVAAPGSGSAAETAAEDATVLPDGARLRRAHPADVPGIAAVMADYVMQGVLLPRPVSELYQCVREFHVVADGDRIVACAALKLLWQDLGEVRSLAVRSDQRGKGLGAALVARVVADARALELARVLALTREVPFFERCGFRLEARETLPRKVWTDCVRCPRRHACDELAVVMDLVPGASEAAARHSRSWHMPIPHAGAIELPVVSTVP